MKNQLLLTLLLLFTSISSYAQITIKASEHTPAIGQKFTYYYQQNASVAATAQTGANQTWDLSQISSSSPIDINIISEASATLPDSFQNVTYVMADSFTENYMQARSADLSITGQNVLGFGTVDYINPREYLFFPMTYGTSQTTTFGGPANFSGQTLTRAGSVTITYDGYGDLILPYGTIKDVARIQTVAWYQDFYGTTSVAQYSDTMIAWYNTQDTAQIAYSNVVNYNGSPVVSVIAYQIVNNPSGVENTDLNNSPYSIFPNPVKNKLTFGNPTSDQMTINIYNVAGAVELSLSDVKGDREIDLSNLAPGMYFFFCNNGKESYTQKFTIQK